MTTRRPYWPPAPTAAPKAAPMPSSNRPWTALTPALNPSSPAAAAIANSTTWVISPSFRPLSTFKARRIRTGTTGFSTVAAPRPASVGAKAAASSNATITGIAGNTSRAAIKTEQHGQRQTHQQQPEDHPAFGFTRWLTRAASWNRINAKVSSATTSISLAASTPATGTPPRSPPRPPRTQSARSRTPCSTSQRRH